VQQRLQQRVRAARGGEGGFTLIELLIVIVILGVLAGIVVFSVNFITDRGTNAACKTDIKNVQAAVEAYRAQNTGYPADMDALTPNFIRSTPDSSATRKYTIAYDGATGLVTGKTGLGAAGDPAC
jgi:type II secretion system protein G